MHEARGVGGEVAIRWAGLGALRSGPRAGTLPPQRPGIGAVIGVLPAILLTLTPKTRISDRLDDVTARERAPY